ncbi:MAG: porin [Burkholderiales bacterium]|nr:porin [Burkholderiales bacterium]
MSAKQAAPAAAAPAGAVTGGDIPGSFKLPGSNTSIKFGGYVKADALFSNRSVGGQGDQLLTAGTIPLGSQANGERGQLTLHARQTRFNMTTSTPSSLGEVRTFFEADFFGPAEGNEVVSNSHSLRLRHAWGSIGGWLAGQTWSNFMDVGAGPELLDFGGPVGQIFIRQAQIKYTQKFAGGQWSASLENPESNISGRGPVGDDRLPDVTGRVDLNMGKNRLTFTGMARQIRIDTAAARDNKWGGAVGFSGVIPTFGKDSMSFTTNYGNVLGRYVVGVFPDGALKANGNLDLSNTWIAMASYQHFWNADLRSSLALSGTRTKFGQGVGGGQTRNAESAHLNLIWSPVKNTNVGIEYIYGHRTQRDGQVGVLNRVQTSAQYVF